MRKEIDDKTKARIMVCRACNLSQSQTAEYVGVNIKTVRKYLNQYKNEAQETTPEETVMHRLSPLATVIIAGSTQGTEGDSNGR